MAALFLGANLNGCDIWGSMFGRKQLGVAWPLIARRYRPLFDLLNNGEFLKYFIHSCLQLAMNIPSMNARFHNLIEWDKWVSKHYFQTDWKLCFLTSSPHRSWRSPIALWSTFGKVFQFKEFSSWEECVWVVNCLLLLALSDLKMLCD